MNIVKNISLDIATLHYINWLLLKYLGAVNKSQIQEKQLYLLYNSSGLEQ